MAVVESPLQSDLPDLNTNSSTSTDTNISSNPSNSDNTSSTIPSTSTTSNHSSINDTSGCEDASSNTNEPVDSDGNVCSSSPVDTSGGDSSKTSTTVSTPVGGMQESTYVLSDSAYVPAKPATVNSATGDVIANNSILSTFSEDSADYSHSKSTSTNNNNQDNDINASNNDNLSPALPLARSVVVRVECAVWSKYTTSSTCSDTFTTISKAVPLQDHHYFLANKGSNAASSGKEAEGKSDLHTELVNCVKVCFYLLVYEDYFARCIRLN